MSNRIAAFALTIVACGSTAAFGQSMTPRSLQTNTLGILEYCQAQGFSSDQAIQAQRNIINHTNPGGPVEAAEATGRQGIFTYSTGKREQIDAVAAERHTTIAHTCQVYSKVAIINSNR